MLTGRAVASRKEVWEADVVVNERIVGCEMKAQETLSFTQLGLAVRKLI